MSRRCCVCGAPVAVAFIGTKIGDDERLVCSIGCAGKAWLAERVEGERLAARVAELEAAQAATVAAKQEACAAEVESWGSVQAGAAGLCRDIAAAVRALGGR